MLWKSVIQDWTTFESLLTEFPFVYAISMVVPTRDGTSTCPTSCRLFLSAKMSAETKRFGNCILTCCTKLSMACGFTFHEYNPSGMFPALEMQLTVWSLLE